MSSWKFSATWVKYGSDKSRRNFTEIHLVTCLHLDAAYTHRSICFKGWVCHLLSLAPPQTQALWPQCTNWWHLSSRTHWRASRFLGAGTRQDTFCSTHEMLQCQTSSEGCLLLVTSWTKKIWGRKWQQLSAHFALFWCFKVCRGGTLTWSHIFSCLDCTFNPVLQIWLFVLHLHPGSSHVLILFFFRKKNWNR